MDRYKQFLIKPEDHFNEFDYPWLKEDLDIVVSKIEKFSPAVREKIAAAIAKGKPITNNNFEEGYTDANLQNSKKLEDLFESSSHNELFRQQLERYIGTVLK